MSVANSTAAATTRSKPAAAPRRKNGLKPVGLAASIRKAMERRGLSTRDVVQRVPRRHIGTVYRLLSGRTTDPWASTVASLCTAISVDPDELLGVADPMIHVDPEIREMLESLQTLTVDDRWLVLGLLRAALARLKPDADQED
ncbi:MAG: helix-turn-helix transcriptional regulator [Chloroflexota bacterium]